MRVDLKHVLGRLVALVSGAGLALAVSGCGGESPSVLSADEVAARYGYEDAVLTPVYALVPQHRDPADGYARTLLAQKCLEGVVEYVPSAPGSSTSFTDERTGQWVLDEPTAQALGYPSLRPYTPAAGGVPDDVEITDSIHDAMVACGAKTDQRLGSPPQRLLNVIEAAGWDAVGASPEMEKVLARWRECMAPVGVPDLPADPTEMPPPSVLSVPVGEDGNGVDGWSGPATPSDRERQVAVADAQCRAQARYYETQHAIRANAELDMIGKNLTEFEAARLAYVDYQQGLDAVIAELG